MLLDRDCTSSGLVLLELCSGCTVGLPVGLPALPVGFGTTSSALGRLELVGFGALARTAGSGWEASQNLLHWWWIENKIMLVDVIKTQSFLESHWPQKEKIK